MNLRVLQFNTLADGLSALRPNLGYFSRVGREVLDWDNRKEQLLQEIIQYDPDIITLQEVDHYYDFFFPQLSQRGYTGYFAPKPTSACLDVSKNSDGCAMFVRRKKLRVISCETKTLALSVAGLEEGELQEDYANIKLQNQVGLIALCEFVCNWKNETSPRSDSKSTSPTSNTKGPFASFKFGEDGLDEDGESPPPPVIISTTHLKSSKSGTGERYRQSGVQQILNETEKIYMSMQAAGRTPAVVLLGDFNAVPQHTDYPPLTYRAVKSHRLGLRSVYNEDIPLNSLSARELYTTWKARKKFSNKETVTKRCIDYIFYSTYVKKSARDLRRRQDQSGGRFALMKGKDVEEDGAVVAYTTAQLAISVLLRTAVLVFLAIIPVTSLIDSSLSVTEKLAVISLSLLGLATFEFAAEGTIFKPAMAAPYSTRQFHQMSEKKFVEKKLTQKMIRASVGALSDYFTAKQATDGRPGFQAVAALDLFSEEEMGESLLPSVRYPSDHLAIAADLKLQW
jgi:nocturnin